MKNHFRTALLWLLPALVACGQSDPKITADAPKLVAGTISAMSADRSSMTVAGQTIQLPALNTTKSAAPKAPSLVLVNGKPSNLNALSVGQQVKVYSIGNVAAEVDIRLEYRGTVLGVDSVSGKLIAAGTTINVSSGTRFDLAGGGRLEISPRNTPLFKPNSGRFGRARGCLNSS